MSRDKIKRATDGPHRRRLFQLQGIFIYPLQLDGMNFYYGVIPNIDSPVPIYTLVVGETHCEGKCFVTTQQPNPEPEPGLLDAEASALVIEIPLFRLPQPKTRLKVQTTCYFNTLIRL